VRSLRGERAPLWATVLVPGAAAATASVQVCKKQENLEGGGDSEG
jgi:hypothetical protein